ncbi:MAG: Ig-like domain-containing protein, partial [Candidatus Binataceae bacterium]
MADFLLKSVTRIVQEQHALIKALACGGFGLAVLLSARGGAWAQTSFQNTNPISLPNTVSSVGPLDANPYPSQISVSGLTGTISKVTVTLNGWTENGASPFPGDRDFLLVGPTGATFEFLGGVGSFHPFTNVSITLDDAAASALSSAQLVPGSFKPTNRLAGLCTNFPTPAPTSSSCAAPNGSATFASVFNGTDPNGTWSLYIMDPFAGDSAGSIGAGWTLTLTMAAAAGTSTTLMSSLNPSFTSAPNNSVMLTAHVTKASDGSKVTESSVTFFDGSSSLSTVNLDGTGSAVLATSFTTEGSHNLSAVFNADVNFGTSTGRLVQFVDNHTTGTPPTFCDAGSITLNTTGGMTAGGTPYPQHIYVTNLTGTVSDITLQLPNIAHNFPRDIDFLLVSPTGVAFVP